VRKSVVAKSPGRSLILMLPLSLASIYPGRDRVDLLFQPLPARGAARNVLCSRVGVRDADLEVDR